MGAKGPREVCPGFLQITRLGCAMPGPVNLHAEKGACHPGHGCISLRTALMNVVGQTCKGAEVTVVLLRDHGAQSGEFSIEHRGLSSLPVVRLGLVGSASSLLKSSRFCGSRQ